MARDQADEYYLTVAEVAELLRLNQQTVRNWIDQGSLPALRVGRRVRIKRSDLDRLLAEGYSAPPQAGDSGPSAEDFWGGEPVGIAEPDEGAELPAADGTTPGIDATTPGIDATTPGTDATTPGIEATTPGTDATTPGVEATTAGAQATTDISATAAPGGNAAGNGGSQHNGRTDTTDPDDIEGAATQRSSPRPAP